MNGSAYIKLTLLATLLLATALTDTEARGGRRGGSLGGIFGGWRKYKKPSSGGGGGGGRRTINGSPMQTAANGSPASAKLSPSSSSSLKAQTQSRTQASYPRQPPNAADPPPSYGSWLNGGAAGAAGAHMPPGSTYYANTAAMPPGAIYYAQPPMQSTSGSGNFLFGLMAGHMLFGHRPHHVTHVYQQSQQPAAAASDGDGKTIIIDNSGGTATVRYLRPGDNNSSTSSSSSRSTETTPPYWPTETRVPLAPFNATVTPAEAIKPDATNTNTNTNSDINSDGATATAQQAPGGIVCVPVLFNETDPSDPSKTLGVERVICFPAPPPPPPSVPPASQPLLPAAAASSTAPQCALRTFIESDPNDPTKTIEVQKEYCSTAATTTKLVQVAGEIGENNNNKNTATEALTTTPGAASTPATATPSTITSTTTTDLSSTTDRPSETLIAA